jgi:hypothetical protein
VRCFALGWGWLMGGLTGKMCDGFWNCFSVTLRSLVFGLCGDFLVGFHVRQAVLIPGARVSYVQSLSSLPSNSYIAILLMNPIFVTVSLCWGARFGGRRYALQPLTITQAELGKSPLQNSISACAIDSLDPYCSRYCDAGSPRRARSARGRSRLASDLTELWGLSAG